VFKVNPKIGKHEISCPAINPVPRSGRNVLEKIIYMDEVTVLDLVFGYEGKMSEVPTLKLN
jgi:hypothetical protein